MYTALIRLENTLIRGVLSVSFPEDLLKIKGFAMYRCSVELGQSQSESEHASLILFQTGFDLCFEQWIRSSGSTEKPAGIFCRLQVAG